MSTRHSTTFARCAVFAITLLSPGLQYAWAQDSAERIPTMDRVCGRLFSVADVNDAVEKDSHPLRNARVRLYRHFEGVDCCDSSAKISEKTTGRGGKFFFDLKKTQRGLYWLSIDFEGREVPLLIRFEPPKGEPDLCANSFAEIDHAGRFVLKALVTVD
jgi:hypothetical protein